MEGECHFLEGNLRAKKRVERAKMILEEIGIGGERVEMYNLSASEGMKFAEIAKEMTEKIKKLGPSPIKGGEKMKAVEKNLTTEVTEGE